VGRQQSPSRQAVVLVAVRSSENWSRRCSAARTASAQIVLVGLTTPPVVSALPSTM